MKYETFERLSEEKQNMILSTGIKAFSLNSYKDVSTDRITKDCHISKGILFHYFGSKKDFYLYCLEKSMQRLIEDEEIVEADNFYDILFTMMDRKMDQSMKYKDEMHMVNMASRDASMDIVEGKTEILSRYVTTVKDRSAKTLQAALSKLNLKETESLQRTVEGLQIYINALLSTYLQKYQYDPDSFFANRDAIKKELKEYLDLMLRGICREG